jgi:hypothetical protein
MRWYRVTYSEGECLCDEYNVWEYARELVEEGKTVTVVLVDSEEKVDENSN